jgi:hypothetical protein
MKAVPILCLHTLALLSSTVCRAQIDDKIQAQRVKSNITLGIGADKKSLRYTTDMSGYVDIKATNVSATPNVAIVGNELNISRQFINPVKYAVSISENELKDPMIESTNKQLALITTLFTQVGALEKVETPTSIKGALGRSAGLKGANMGQVNSFELSLVKIRSQRMLQLAFDLLQNATCYDVASLAEFFNNVGNLEEYCAKHGSQAQSTLEAMRTFDLPIGGAMDAISLNKPITDDLNELSVFESNASTLLPSIQGFTSQLRAPAGVNSCNEVKVLVSKIVDDYVAEKKNELKKRKEINELLAKQNELLKEEITASVSNISKPIPLSAGTIKEVTIIIKERVFDYSSDRTTLINTEKDLIASKIIVHKYYPILLEAGVGIIYAPKGLEFPEFTIGSANNKNVIIKSKTSITRVIAAGLLNFVPNIGPSPVHPMLQIGVGTGNERPTLYGGLGFRFGKPLNKFALTFGFVGYWTRTLEEGVLEGSEIKDAAALNEKLKYEDLKSRFAFGIQRNF